jgi:hypothetical protein
VPDEVADARLGHHRNGHGFLDRLDQFRGGHAGDAALFADVGGDAFQRHHGDRAGFLGDQRLFDRGDIHNDAALEHLGELAVEAEAFGLGRGAHGAGLQKCRRVGGTVTVGANDNVL